MAALRRQFLAPSVDQDVRILNLLRGSGDEIVVAMRMNDFKKAL